MDDLLNRGKYLVEGPGHCGACHTPRGVGFQETALSLEDGDTFLSGALIDGWRAKSLRGEAQGLDSWTREEIVEFLAFCRASALPVDFVSTHHYPTDDFGLPGDDSDEQARFIEGVFSTDKGALRVVSLYLPNGNPIEDERKFPYKLSWMARLESWAAERLELEEALILAGDYNVIPEAIDARHPENWLGDALFQPQTRQAWRRLVNLGFTEAVRAVTDAGDTYTFWDYQAGAWQKNNGIRIDHLLLSPEAANRFSSADIEKHVRAWEKPSDHVPVAIELDLKAA